LLSQLEGYILLKLRSRLDVQQRGILREIISKYPEIIAYSEDLELQRIRVRLAEDVFAEFMQKFEAEGAKDAEFVFCVLWGHLNTRGQTLVLLRCFLPVLLLFRRDRLEEMTCLALEELPIFVLLLYENVTVVTFN